MSDDHYDILHLHRLLHNNREYVLNGGYHYDDEDRGI